MPNDPETRENRQKTLSEIIEDIGLAFAIKEGKASGLVTEQEVFEILRGGRE